MLHNSSLTSKKYMYIIYEACKSTLYLWEHKLKYTTSFSLQPAAIMHMAWPISFIFLAVALLIVTSYGSSSAENVYCVTPTATSCSSCPHNSTHCATLSEYAEETELYFTSNTTIVFLPGDHVLDRNIIVVNVARLNMLGESSSESIATVVRNGPVGFNLTNMVDFNMYSLAFTSGNRSWGYGPASSFALFLQSTQYAKLVNCSFHNNHGTALTVRNTNITLAENNEFVHNQCGCGSFGEMHEFGCGVTTFNSNLTFTGNISFYNITQTAFSPYVNCAGAIWASASSLHFTGTSNFIGNSANGINAVGVIYAEANTLLSFSGTSNFTHNSAEVGGVIGTVDNVAFTFNGTNIFFNNSASDSGGAIFAASNTSLSFIGTNQFSHNSAERNGGAIGTADNVVLIFNGTNNFISNSAEYGGAIDTYENVVVTFNGTNNFINNSAERNGGAIDTNTNVVLTFNGTNNFINNTAEQNGGAIRARNSKLLSFTETSSFCHNAAAEYGGAMYTENNVVLTFNEINNFINNSAESGGAIGTYENVIFTFNGTNSFINNSAERGGAVDAYQNSVLTFSGTNNFINNSANKNSGGAIHAVNNASLIFIGASNFSHNSAGYEGGANVTAGNAALIFNGTNNFINNSADNGGAIFAVVNTSLSFTGTSSFSRNLAMQGGAISANSNSILTFNGNINFTNNGHNIRDSRGGAMHLAIGSTSFILPNTTICWENNYANLGGAIYVLTDDPFNYCKKTQIATFIPKQDCFLQLPGQNLSSGLDVQLVFKNNSAFDAGSVLYGGAIDNCCLDPYDFCDSGPVFDKLVQYEADNTTSVISSDPFRVCFCENDHPNCSKSIKTLSVYPGETVQVSLVTVGQREGIVPSAVRSCPNKGRLETSQYIQQTTTTCAIFNYTVFSQQDASLELYPDGPCSTVSDKLFIQLSIRQTCPPGFALKNSSVSCVCDQILQKYTNNCNITNGLGQITRESDDTFWAGYDSSQGFVFVHPFCPFDYCVTYTMTFPLNSTLSDMQCAYNRSGFLCGACKGEYSLVLGTSQCRKCTNSHLALLIPFAVMGVALVFLLLVYKLTVATGTLSGLVFYANIVGVNRTIFLPVKSTDALSVFIAWINFDFGIETCFYNGMDGYSKTWLQFVFPVYLWVLVGLVILVSHFSQRFANLLGSNPVSVLATLILLSYAKILRTLITAVYVTYLKYPANYSRMVWLHDANIDYLSGKHIPLFLVAVLVFIFLFLPYTLLLLFSQWLQAISHLRLFSWVNSARLKPFMDSYHAPYKAKHRYWPGLLLVLRFVLLLVFALNPQQDPNINLLVILLGAGVLQLWAWVSGGVYRNWCLDALEGSFVLNLIILAAATYYVKLSEGSQLAVGYTSASIALKTFIGILSYHIFQQMRHTKLWKKVPKLNLEPKKLNTKQAVNNLNNPVNNPTESVNLDQFHEPWLEDLLQPTHSSL